MLKTPTRFPHGVTNAGPESALRQFGLPDPTSWYVFFDDFYKFTSDQWTITTVETGTGSATATLNNEDGGILQLTNDDAASDSQFLQWSGDNDGTHETFVIGPRKSVLKTRFKVNDVGGSNWLIGLHKTSTTPMDDVDGIYFTADGSDGSVAIVLRSNFVETKFINLVTPTDDTYLELAFYFDGEGQLKIFVDDALLGEVTINQFPSPETLTVGFGHQNRAASAQILAIDYLLVAVER